MWATSGDDVQEPVKTGEHMCAASFFCSLWCLQLLKRKPNQKLSYRIIQEVFEFCVPDKCPVLIFLFFVLKQLSVYSQEVYPTQESKTMFYKCLTSTSSCFAQNIEMVRTFLDKESK